MQRDSADYKRFQRAWILCQTEEWKEYLKPMLENWAEKKTPNITSQDAAFKAAFTQGDTERASAVIASVEYDAKRFTEVKLTL